MCLHVYAASVGTVGVRRGYLMGSPRAGVMVIMSCLTWVGAGNQTQVPEKSRKHSCPLSHLSSPELILLNKELCLLKILFYMQT